MLAVALALLALALLAPRPAAAARPDPAGWFAGDMHAHRSCGGAPASITSIRDAMVAADLDVVSLLADMGNAEVQNATTDLPLVNGSNDPVSTATRLVHWDAEWHWDPIYWQYAHQALGGHIVALGLSEAHQIWNESTYPIFSWAHQQGAIAGFAHFQYLDDGVPQALTCCTPVEYPVEVALGAADFISEDVTGSDAAVHAYYRLLNCGFRPAFAAGSDAPCGSTIGSMITYAQVAGGTLSYAGWIQGIATGRTVVSRVGRHQFLALRVNGTATPGDQIALAGPGDVAVSARWTADGSYARTLELVRDGVVVASRAGSVTASRADSVEATVHFDRSGWLCARVTGAGGHEVHTAAVFVSVNGAPVRASVSDARFYIQWITSLLQRTSPGGDWNGYFPTGLAAAQARYQAALALYQQIAREAETAAGPPYSLFQPGDQPAYPDENDGTPLEVGVKFQADTDGSISGFRFYKGASNTGTHVAHLWTRAGGSLATATFANETAQGWQQVTFAPPVAIAAGVTLVASVHSAGGYASDPGFFTTEYVSGPLRALADGEDGGNGLFLYTATPAFPTDTWQASNYWVDVVFTPAPAGFTITATAGTGGHVTPGGSVAVAAGGSQAFAIAPDACFAIAAVLVDGVDRGPVGTYTFNNVQANHTLAATFLHDDVPPAAVTALAATQVTSGNDADGTTRVRLTFTAPGDGSTVLVYRAGFGNYPAYQDGPTPGSDPTQGLALPLPARWQPTAVTASGQTDEVAARDFWYYVAVTSDGCGSHTLSAPSAGVLNYRLGDVANGIAPCQGDNLVGVADISALGSAYGAGLAVGDPRGCMDVGPTVGDPLRGRPAPDRAIDFEDLTLFAINYGPGPAPPGIAAGMTPAPGGTSVLGLEVGAPREPGSTFDAVLRLDGAGDVQALGVTLAWNAERVEPAGVGGGELLERQPGPARVFSTRPGSVDAAVLGHGAAFTGSGELARVTFRVLGPGDPGVRIASVRARDGSNARVTLSLAPGAPAPAAPAHAEMASAYPNPFNGSTTFVIGLPRPGRVELVVYDVLGRAVRRLAAGEAPAGWSRVVWDGRGDDGGRLPQGSYVVRLLAGERRLGRTVRLVR
jgi:hypothetical protein